MVPNMFNSDLEHDRLRGPFSKRFTPTSTFTQTARTLAAIMSVPAGNVGSRPVVVIS